MDVYNEFLQDPKLGSQQPMILLKDCLADHEMPKSSGKVRSMDTDSKHIEPPKGLLTPEPSGTSEDGSEDDVKQLYEVEKIVGYNITDNKLWYLIKWKGYSKQWNNFEPIENLTNCNRLLMKFFEWKKPTAQALLNMEQEVVKGLESHKFYLNLIESSYDRKDIKAFEDFFRCEFPDVSKMWNSDLEKHRKKLEIEYRYILRCLIGMESHRDPGMFSRAMNFKLALNICDLRRDQVLSLEQLKSLVNEKETCPVEIENNVDLEVIPDGLEYITELVPGQGVVFPTEPILWCECRTCDSRSACCAKKNESTFAYTKEKRLKLESNRTIYECTSKCSCGPECINRVVQLGRKIPVAIFKTRLCGWGVKALRNIQKGEFVCEYIGEVISENESILRDLEYWKIKSSYMFDLDFSLDKKAEYTIDSTKKGNLSRFINHSCDPNLVVCPVWINSLAHNMPRLAFFAKRDICANEELRFDYGNHDDRPPPEADDSSNRAPVMLSAQRCLCGSANCRQSVFGNI